MEKENNRADAEDDGRGIVDRWTSDGHGITVKSIPPEVKARVEAILAEEAKNRENKTEAEN